MRLKTCCMKLSWVTSDTYFIKTVIAHLLTFETGFLGIVGVKGD